MMLLVQERIVVRIDADAGLGKDEVRQKLARRQRWQGSGLGSSLACLVAWSPTLPQGICSRASGARGSVAERC